jgi:sulfotransferase 6B1
MPKRNQIERLFVFAQKRFRALSGKLISVRSKSIDTRILINSIPKAGTNLAERAIELLPWTRPKGFRTLMDWHGSSSRIVDALCRIQPRQYRVSHIPFCEAYLKPIRHKNIRVIFIIRDPRDVVVSNAKYVTEIDYTHRTHRAMSKFDNENDRLLAVICGIEGLLAPVEQVWKRFLGWMSAPNTLLVRFEDLIGPKGGGDEARQIETVRAILRHLGIDPNSEIVSRVTDSVYSPDVSTFRQGRIGNWKDHFGEIHKAEFKQRTGSLLLDLGYEQSFDW